ncbi:MAG: phosphoribosylamine--glycine ligase [Bacteroidota bacterium]
MRILLLGSGGREHAFAWKLSQSPRLDALFTAPGNGGTSQHGTNLAISYNDFEAIKSAVLTHQIDLVIVGPEEPLVNGIYDYFKADAQLAGVRIIGPSKEAAQLEGSKAYAKKFMQRHGIPTAAYREFTADTLSEGLAYLDTQTPPIVLKADGLAAGKGVLILDDLAVAKKELEAMLGGKFGAASSTVVVEQFLKGLEFSVFVVTDGKDYQLLPVAKDYKRIGEGDTGLNTGGMGAVSPPPFVDEVLMDKVIKRIVEPTVNGLAAEELIYKGFIFFGLIEVGGEPYVIEYNCRMGDPETEVVFPRMESDLLEVLVKLDDGELGTVEVGEQVEAAATVILVSGGYPQAYEKGKVISGLEATEDSLIFHAGTKMADGQLVTNGGRVIAITSFGLDFQEAVAQSLKNAATIDFDGKYFRSDIGFDL